MMLGQKYWNNFCQHHSNQLSAKRAICFDSNQDGWCTVQNFEQMYEKVYESMVNCRVAVKSEDEPQWLNHNGEPVAREEDAYGRKAQHSLVRPDKVLFVDEVGCNTSQNHNGNIGGKKFLINPNSQA